MSSTSSMPSSASSTSSTSSIPSRKVKKPVPEQPFFGSRIGIGSLLSCDFAAPTSLFDSLHTTHDEPYHRRERRAAPLAGQHPRPAHPARGHDHLLYVRRRAGSCLESELSRTRWLAHFTSCTLLSQPQPVKHADNSTDRTRSVCSQPSNLQARGFLLRDRLGRVMARVVYL